MEFEEQRVENTMVSEGIKNTKSTMRKAGWFFFILMILELPMAVVVALLQDIIPADYSVLVSILCTQGYMLLGGIIYCIVAKQSPVQDLCMKRYRLSTFFLSIVLLIVASPMASWLNVFSQLFAKNTTSNAIYSVTEAVPMGIGILIIGCLPGFIEEMICRGIFYSAFRKRSVLTGVVISSLAFGLMHLNFNQMAYAVYLGVVFALLVEATGSLVSSMILHMIFNAVNTGYVYILPVMYEYMAKYSPAYADFDMEAAMSAEPQMSELLGTVVMMAPFAIGGVVLTVLLLRLIAKINGREFTWAYIRGDRENVKQTKPVNVGLILGFVFCLSFCIIELVNGLLK